MTYNCFSDEFVRQCHIYAVVEKEQIFKDIFKSKNANDEAKLQNWVTKVYYYNVHKFIIHSWKFLLKMTILCY